MKQEYRRHKIKNLGTLTMFLIMCGILFGLGVNATAQDKILAVTMQKIYVDDVFDLSDCLVESETKDVTFTMKNSNQPGGITESTLFHASEAGNYVIQVTRQEEDEQTTTEELTVLVVSPENIEWTYGENVTLPVESYVLEQSYQLEADTASVSLGEKGEAQVVGFQKTKIMATNTRGDSFLVAEITIKQPLLDKNTVVVAKGGKAQTIQLQNFISRNAGQEKQVWSTVNSSIAKWDNEGVIGVAKGETEVCLHLTAYNGEQIELTAQVIVTEPKISEQTIVLAAGCKKALTISGTVTQSTLVYDSNQSGAAYFTTDGKIYANYKGTKKLKVTIDGLTFTVNVRVSNPTYGQFTVILYKGMRKNLKLKGLVSGSKVTYKSSKKSVLTITSKGKMKAKKTGHAVITVKADGKTLKLWTEISSKRGYQASKKAIAISKTKTTYSQARRMSKGYYDCSSLISRVYRKYGVYFGSRRGWSPVAADIGKWCAYNHKVIAKKSVSYKKLLPGDLIFFSGWKNGRYKNITHIEIYTGAAMDVSASSRFNKVVHYGYGKGDTVVLIARPTK